MIVNMIMHQKKDKVKEILCRKNQWNNRYINSNFTFGGNIQLSMEGIAVQYFPISIDPISNKKKLDFINI